ncbi:Rop family plasmid primer RNA-binding protein [Escherichia coli]|nr:Rop family plasmid primer RNA-binding protein [Escherichia coli]
MNKQQQTALNMARFIKSQSLTLLEKLDALDADEQAAMCEPRQPGGCKSWCGRI